MMHPETTTRRCLNCGKEYQGNFCPECGQSYKTKRFTMKGTIAEALAVFTKFDDSFLFTIRNLFTRPGYMIRRYLEGHRVCYFKPLRLLVFLTTVYLIVQFLLPGHNATTEAVVNADVQAWDTDVPDEIIKWLINGINIIINNKLIMTLTTVIFFVPPAKWCFRKTPYGHKMNLAEHFYARVYVSCQAMIIAILFLFIDTIFNDYSLNDIYNTIVFFLIIWDYAQLMKIRWWRSFKLCIYTSFLMIIFVTIVLLPFITVLVLIGNSMK